MAKYNVGDEVAIAAIMKISAIQPQRDGSVSYSTDRGITIHEALVEQIALAPKSQAVEEPKPAPQPAHRFKVGDRVVEAKAGYGIGEIIEVDTDDKMIPYRVKFDGGVFVWLNENRLSAAPEPPKFYTGKVFAVEANPCWQRSIEITRRNGHVIEIKCGRIVGNNCGTGAYKEPYESFDDFCAKNFSTVWHEVKE